MKDFMTPFKVGLLVIVSVLAGFFMLTRLTSDGGGDSGEYIKVYTMFSDATGLAERSRVRLAGIPVGEISSISLDGDKARIELLVRKDLDLKRGTPPAEDGDRKTHV